MEKMVDKSIFDGRETKIFFLMLKNNTSIICNQNLFGMKGISKKTNDDIKKGLVCVFPSN